MTTQNAKRLLFPEVGRVQWETFEIPADPDPHTVVAETQFSLISVGTELALYTGSHIGFTLPNPPFPMMPQRPGYALVGLVTAVGHQVRGIRPGERVMMEAPHGTVGVVDTSGGTVVPLPEGLGDAEGTLVRMADIALTAVRLAPLQLGEAVAVLGLGLVGQLAAQLFRLHGAHPAIGLDRIPSRLQVAQGHGIVALDTGQVDVHAAVADLTDGRGPEVVVEATGSPTVVALALELVATGGRVVLLGSTRGRVDLDVYSHVHRKGVQIIGAHESVKTSPSAVGARWPKARNLRLLADLFAQGELRCDGLISHTIRPQELPAIYDTLALNPHEYLGVVVDWRQGV